MLPDDSPTDKLRNRIETLVHPARPLQAVHRHVVGKLLDGIVLVSDKLEKAFLCLEVIWKAPLGFSQ